MKNSKIKNKNNVKELIIYLGRLLVNVLLVCLIFLYKLIFRHISESLEKSYINMLSNVIVDFCMLLSFIYLILLNIYEILKNIIIKFINLIQKIFKLEKIICFVLYFTLIGCLICVIYVFLNNNPSCKFYHFILIKIGLNYTDKYKLLCLLIPIIGCLGTFIGLFQRNINNKEELTKNTYNTASKNLLSKNEIERLNCIYSLYEIAKQDVEYREKVSNIFVSHIKTITRQQKYKDKYKNSPAQDIQLIFDLRFRLKNKSKIFRFKNNGTFDFSSCYLKGLVLNNTIISNFNFSDAILEKSDFSSSIICNSNFDGATLKNADLSKSIFFDVSYNKAILENVDIKLSVLLSINFMFSNLSDCDFSHTWIDFCKINNDTIFNNIKLFSKISKNDFKTHGYLIIFKHSILFKIIKSGLLSKKTRKISTEYWLQKQIKNKKFKLID